MSAEATLIKRCIKKDREAQKFLFERYAPVLLGICRRYVATDTEAEDILQEGFVKIFLNLRSFAGKGTLLNWMKKIMVNTSITYYHRNYKHRYHRDIDDPQNVEIGKETFSDEEFTHTELLAVIDRLPEGYRMVFNLYAIEGYKHREIAEMLNIDVNTSKSQYSRAKRAIRGYLEQMSIRKLKIE